MRLKKSFAFVLLVIMIFSLSIGAMVRADGKEVTVRYVDRFSGRETKKDYKTEYETVEEFIDDADIKKGEFDIMSHKNSDIIEDGVEITITKAVPVTVVKGDESVTAVTTMPTVSGALDELLEDVSEDDIVSPSRDEKVSDGMTIVITRVSDEEFVDIEYRDFDTVYRDDNTLLKGETKVVQEGKKGETKVTYYVTYENGKRVSSEEISREKVSDPKPKIIARGTKAQSTASPTASAGTAAPSKSASVGTIAGRRYTKSMDMTATAYSAFNSKGGYAKTASGMTAKKGIVAVDRKVIPLGTRLYIEGYGEAIAGDVGGAIKGNKIDLCFEDTNANLKKFGRKTVKVYILE